MHLSSQASVNFTMKPVHCGEKTHKIELLLLLKILSDIPSCSVAFNRNCKHLSNLTLAIPEFRVPGNVDILIRADVFSYTVVYSRWFGPSGSHWLSRPHLFGYWPALFESPELRVNSTIVVLLPHLLMTSLGDFRK